MRAYPMVLAARLRHPSILRVFDLGLMGHLPYPVLELAPGGSLRKRLSDLGRFSVRQTLAVMVPVAEALSVCHEAGIIHRDLKPENVLLAAGGRPV